MTKYEEWQKAVGNCPTCDRLPTWFNDVPLKAFCWGETNREHQEMRREVPAPFQPYGKGKKKTAWKAILRQNKKATQEECGAANLLYRTTGSLLAVLSFAKSLGIKVWSKCKNCEIKTPDTVNNFCFVCGTEKEKPCRQKK